MPLIYFLRHGQTDYNASKRIQGTLEIPINEKGRQQACRNGSLLAELIERRDRFDFVASPLLRARQTMEIVRDTLGLPAQGYRTDDRLKEISFGAWAGLTWPDIEARDPEAYVHRQADRWNVAAPGGNTYRDVYRAVVEWVESVTSDTVVVAHYGTARCIRGYFLKLGPAEILDLDVPQDKVLMIEGDTLTWL
jgi:broad specificity phosphatase PhoE